MPHTTARSTFGSMLIIATVVGGMGIGFAYTAGWLSPGRLSGNRIANAFGPKTVPGHRLNHAKGVCFTGTFQANGEGRALSRAPMLVAGGYPVVGRLNLGTPNPFATDQSARVRGIGLQIAAPDGQVWRTAMINAPVFAVSTPTDFYALLQAGGSKDPDAMKDFAGAHPGMVPFLGWMKDGTRTGSYAEERYNSLDSFLATNADGVTRAIRWSIVPQAVVQDMPVAAFAKTGPDVLEQEIAARVAQAPTRWTMRVQVANPGDITNDPSKTWPADRRTVAVGDLIVDKIIPEADGPCRDLNFDPTVLPTGLTTSDDPFPAARSAVYAKSYDRRTAAATSYPHKNSGNKNGGAL